MAVKVYFETDSTAVLVAVFNDEDLYEVCIDALEAKCLRDGYDVMTETITDEDLPVEEDEK